MNSQAAGTENQRAQINEARGSGASLLRFDLTLRMLRFFGLIGFLGGLAALTALTWLSPKPADQAQWILLISVTRAVFYPCVFCGILLLLIVGGTIWWRRRHVLNPQGWFRSMMVIIIITVPILHLWARSSMLAMCAAVEAGRLDDAGAKWTQLSWAFLLSLLVYFVTAAIGIIKPTFARGPR